VYVEDDDDDSDEEGARKVIKQACQVVWEGVVLDRAFTDWKVCTCTPSYELVHDNHSRSSSALVSRI
jgi:hypothetical protein